MRQAGGGHAAGQVNTGMTPALRRGFVFVWKRFRRLSAPDFVPGQTHELQKYGITEIDDLVGAPLRRPPCT